MLCVFLLIIIYFFTDFIVYDVTDVKTWKKAKQWQYLFKFGEN